MIGLLIVLVSPPFGKLPDGGFDVAAQLLRQTVHLHLFRLSFVTVSDRVFLFDLFNS